MKVQFINDSAGQPQYVVVPVEDYNRLIALEDELAFEDIPYQADSSDAVTIPHEVITIMHDEDSSLLAAWRIYRDLSQAEVAARTGLTQSSISQAEKKGSNPHFKTCERLAGIYGCKPEQLML